MRKNLVLFHLESLSQNILWNFRRELGTVWRLMESSLSFRRFQASATSSMMAVVDCLHGNSLELDHNYLFSNQTRLAGKSINLFEYLQMNDYEVYGTGFPPLWRDDVNTWPVWPKEANGCFYWHDDFSRWLGAMQGIVEGAKRKGKPFALYVWDLRSHLYYQAGERGAATNFAERFRLGYSQMDQTVNAVLSMLSNKGVWDDTVIAAYGDHGDELWTHAMNGGYCHGIEPYATMCRTPMFIYVPGEQPGEVDALASMIDVKPTLLGLLFPEKRFESPDSPFYGINLLNQQRSLAFSQNLFALQQEQGQPLQALLKSYAVTDGEYRLLATSGGDNPERGGMELYFDAMDPGNGCNLLRFFDLSADGAPASFDYRGGDHVHIRRALQLPLAEDLAKRYAAMRAELVAFVRQKEKEALTLAGKEASRFPESAFNRIRRPRSEW